MKVVDASADVAGRFAAKLLAMAGMDVIRLGARDDTPLGRYLDAHKRIVDPPEDDLALRTWCDDADVVFTTFDQGRIVGAVARPGVRPLPNGCVEVTTSSFGMTGPYATWRGGPVADWAAGGYLALTGWPDRAPLLGPEHLCGYVAGYTAAIAAEAALADRRRTGRGRHVDVSTMESMLNVHQSTFSRLAAGVVRTRTGRYTEVYPLVVRPCRDGYVSIGVVTDAEFDRLLIAIGRPDLAADERFRDAAARGEHRDELDAVLHEYLGTRRTADVVAKLLAHGVATAAVDGAQAVLANPQLSASGFWDELPSPTGSARAPGNPVPAATAPSAPSTSPDAARPSSRLATARDPSLPLAGIVVLDFTAFWAGPSATRILADLGARVIWVERPHSRRDLGPDASETEVVMNYFHLKMNRNKESVVLDLGTADGRAAVARLASEADVLVENFRPGVLDAMGLGPAQLCATNPRLVAVSLSGFGSAGPWASRRSYGPTIEAASSIESRTGYADDEPMRLGHTLPDGVGGLLGALAALRGLRERDQRAHGGWFDLSQLEAYVSLSGEELLLAAETGEELARVGNRSRGDAIQGVFPCRGDDRWIAIRLADADDVARLPVVSGAADLESMEVAIGAWTARQDAVALAAQLQDLGIEAFAVLTPPELLADAHLTVRGFFVDVDHDGWRLRLPGSPLHGLVDPRGPAPGFGAHTDLVLEGLGAGG